MGILPDDKDFEELYNTYSPIIYRLCMVRLQNPSDAEDATANVFVKAMSKNFSSCDHAKAWLIRVAINECANISRKSGRISFVNIDDLPETPYFDEQYSQTLLEIYKLSAKLRDVVYMFYYLDYSIEKIAQILAVSQSVVGTRLNRARKKLKIQIEEDK